MPRVWAAVRPASRKHKAHFPGQSAQIASPVPASPSRESGRARETRIRHSSPPHTLFHLRECASRSPCSILRDAMTGSPYRPTPCTHNAAPSPCFQRSPLPYSARCRCPDAACLHSPTPFASPARDPSCAAPCCIPASHAPLPRTALPRRPSRHRRCTCPAFLDSRKPAASCPTNIDSGRRPSPARPASPKSS